MGIGKTPLVSIPAISKNTILHHITYIGKELREDIELESCDLGNQSVLHAVKVLRKPAARIDLEVRKEDPTLEAQILVRILLQAGIPEDDDSSDSDQGAAPLASTLVEFQLEGEARKAREAQRAHFFCWCSLKVKSSQKVSLSETLSE